MRARPVETLLVQHHIPKTGGTSIRHVTRANFKPSELLQIDWWTQPFRGLAEREAARQPEGDAPFEIPPALRATLIETAREYYRSLPHRERVRCFMGHLAGCMIPVVDDRPVRAACMLRDPVDRVVSLLRYSQWADARGNQGLGTFRATAHALHERGWTLKDAYRELGGSGPLPPELAVPFGPLFNGQARHLLAAAADADDIPFSSATEDLEQPRERLFELLTDRYVVGTQDRFPQSLRLFADSFGWSRVFVMRARPGPKPGEVEGVDEETRTLIRAHNGLDAELHAHFSDRLSRSPSVTTASRLRGSAYLRLGRVRRLRRRASGRLGRSLAARANR